MSRILDSIHEPSDLRELSYPQLNQLAAEIREELVRVVENNGGHLASNLGVVELSIALHRIFDSPRDKFVWDTGHQSYVHKLLTGRRERFTTLRQQGGISGFADQQESPHDAFTTGHAGTSVSAALGIAISRDLAMEDYHVIAIIGDGALTAGMALEGMNQAGHTGTRVIVILNDNGMAISPNVGGFSKALNRVRFDHRYLRAKELGEVINRLPLGPRVLQTGKRAKDSFMTLFLPTMILEELGFTYMGPIDGHNIAALEVALRQVQSYTAGGPVFIHVATQKGRGYTPAEEDAVSFHGVPPNGKGKTAPTYSEIFGQTLIRLMEKEPRILAITAAMEDGTGLRPVATEFPDRMFDVGICEQHAVTFAAGLATQGFIPIVAIYSTFLQRAFDQVLHDVCIQSLSVVFAIDRSGIVSDDGKTHQGCFDLAYLSCIPNLVVCAPKDDTDLQHLLYTATRANRPMAIRYPRGSGTGAPLLTEFKEIPIGSGEVLREGDDLALLALGVTVAPALKAAEVLEKNGIHCTVIDMRFVKPLDSKLVLDLATRIKQIITIEEGCTTGGIGSAVLQLLQKEGLHDVHTRCLGIPDEFPEHASQQFLRHKYHLDAAGIAEEVLATYSRVSSPPRTRKKAKTTQQATPSQIHGSPSEVKTC